MRDVTDDTSTRYSVGSQRFSLGARWFGVAALSMLGRPRPRQADAD